MKNFPLLTELPQFEEEFFILCLFRQNFTNHFQNFCGILTIFFYISYLPEGLAEFPQFQ